MISNEIPVEFQCAGSQLFGVLHSAGGSNKRGVVILTGRYRCGHHRWYVLQAREWARAGHPVLRFSARGTGDSEGSHPFIEDLGPDFANAIDEFFRQEPDLEEVVLWGLCAEASAALLYAPTDPRVSGVVLVNPYLETHLHGVPVPGETSAAWAYLLLMLRRVGTQAFWKKVFQREINWSSATGRIKRHLLTALGLDIPASAAEAGKPSCSQRLVEALREFQGRVLLIFSGGDLEASIARNILLTPPWRRLCSSKLVAIRELHDADHVFSRRTWSDQASAWTLTWLNSWQ